MRIGSVISRLRTEYGFNEIPLEDKLCSVCNSRSIFDSQRPWAYGKEDPSMNLELSMT